MSVGSERLRVVVAIARALDGVQVVVECGGDSAVGELSADEETAGVIIDALERDGWQLVRT